MGYQHIETFVDLSIQDLIECDFDLYVNELKLDRRLLDETKPQQGKQLPWKPIDSLIEDNEIADFEQELKHPLPESFKHYLKYKNFYELGVISSVHMFTPLIPGAWKNEIIDSACKGYSKIHLYDNGLIPFARYSDYGLVCFDTNCKDQNGEYEVVKWDHEDPENAEPMASNFAGLMEDLVKKYNEGMAGGILIIEKTGCNNSSCCTTL